MHKNVSFRHVNLSILLTVDRVSNDQAQGFDTNVSRAQVW